MNRPGIKPYGAQAQSRLEKKLDGWRAFDAEGDAALTRYPVNLERCHAFTFISGNSAVPHPAVKRCIPPKTNFLLGFIDFLYLGIRLGADTSYPLPLHKAY